MESQIQDIILALAFDMLFLLFQRPIEDQLRELYRFRRRGGPLKFVI